MTVKTGRGLFAGTDAVFIMTINGCSNSKNILEINGYGSKLERNRSGVL